MDIFISNKTNAPIYEQIKEQIKTQIVSGELKEGDAVEVEYLGVSHSDRVTGSLVTTPDDLSVLMPTEKPTLTLITCHPRGSGKERLIVTAEPS